MRTCTVPTHTPVWWGTKLIQNTALCQSTDLVWPSSLGLLGWSPRHIGSLPSAIYALLPNKAYSWQNMQPQYEEAYFLQVHNSNSTSRSQMLAKNAVSMEWLTCQKPKYCHALHSKHTDRQTKAVGHDQHCLCSKTENKLHFPISRDCTILKLILTH